MGSTLISACLLLGVTWIPSIEIPVWLKSCEAQLALATLLAGTGLWSLVPGSCPCMRARAVGWSAVLLGLGWMLKATVPISVNSSHACVIGFSLMAILSAILMITEARPFYSAIWFALVLASVGGLFLLYGAQFLGIATIAVYAGAIVVTFLFVLMLAHPFGHTFFDRLSWGSLPRWLSCVSGMGVTAILLWCVTEAVTLTPVPGQMRPTEVEHVAAFGAQLFSKQLLGVELAGILLTAALVGAIAMAAQRSAGGKLARHLDRAFQVGKINES